MTLSRYVKENDIDVIVCFLERSNVTGYFVGVITGRNTIISVRNNLRKQYSSTSPIKRFLLRKLLSFIYRRCKYVVSLSKGVEYQLKTDYDLKGNLVHIYNFYDTKYMRNSVSNLKPLDISFYKEKYFVAVGRLTEQKGFDTLLKVFAQYKLKGGKNNLFIVGEGELAEYLQELVLFYGLSRDVTFLGFRKDTASIIKDAEALVFTSRWEGFGNAAVESIIYGTPLISFDCPFGPREILGVDYSCKVSEPIYNKYGILLPENDIEFSKHSPLSEPELEMLQALINHSKDSFSYSELVNRSDRFDMRISKKKWQEVINNAL